MRGSASGRAQYPPGATRCPHVVLRDVRYWHIAYAGICLCACYALPSTDIAHSGICLRACYAVSGTDIAYAARSRGPRAWSKIEEWRAINDNVCAALCKRCAVLSVCCARRKRSSGCSSPGFHADLRALLANAHLLPEFTFQRSRDLWLKRHPLPGWDKVTHVLPFAYAVSGTVIAQGRN
eukprot:2702992-Rhodomonas_salina.1